MGRFNIVSGAITQNNPLTVLIDTQGEVMGVSLQNVSATDFYWSFDPTLLQTTSPANLPQVGHHFAPDGAVTVIVVLNPFVGKIYARAQATGAQGEANAWPVCPTKPSGISG